MDNYSKEEQKKIIKNYFGPSEDGENPRCSQCGDILHFKTIHASEKPYLKISVSCSDCRFHFVWHQPSSQEPWKSLHLDYFMERHRIEKPIRCPFDDCYITYTEFSDAVIEFRCPYCNHCGTTTLKDGK